jgi:hypothetical protein
MQKFAGLNRPEGRLDGHGLAGDFISFCSSRPLSKDRAQHEQEERDDGPPTPYARRPAAAGARPQDSNVP